MRPDVAIAGAGLIGMACALDCARRGLHVLLLDRGRAGQEASSAAAGMLAVHDPANPTELTALAERSMELYPAFLEGLAEGSGHAVPLETDWTLEAAAGETADAAPAGMQAQGFRRIAESSLAPRKLTGAAVAAVRHSTITLREGTPVLSAEANGDGVTLRLAGGTALHCARFVDCTGAWSGRHVRPVKGQMLRVHAPGALRAGTLGNVVVRTDTFYLVPRLDGSVVVGATLEDAGFDKALQEMDLNHLRDRAAALVPTLWHAPELERWAGLRPGTPDGLPLIGPWPQSEATPHRFVAAGHFRNGILLAPATAHVVTQLVLGEAPSVALTAFAPNRFVPASA